MNSKMFKLLDTEADGGEPLHHQLQDVDGVSLKQHRCSKKTQRQHRTQVEDPEGFESKPILHSKQKMTALNNYVQLFLKQDKRETSCMSTALTTCKEWLSEVSSTVSLLGDS